MNIENYKQKADIIRDNDIYRVYDLGEMDRLTLSLTELKAKKNTTGHSHKEAEEIHIFISGRGIMENGAEKENVKKGDVILIPKGNFHKVYNKGWKPLKFWSVFEKYEGRGK